MSEKIKKFLEESAVRGMYLPLAYDAGKPSITMFFSYLANTLAIISLALLHVKGEPFVATLTTTSYAIIQTVLYMLRRLSKAKIDLDDRSFDLEGEEDEKTSTSN